MLCKQSPLVSASALGAALSLAACLGADSARSNATKESMTSDEAPAAESGSSEGDPRADGVTEGGSDAAPPCQWGTTTGSCVRVSGRRLFLDGKSFHVKAVAWNPVARGGSHPQNLDFAGYAPVDIPLMRGASINAVRTYEPLLDTQVLDQLHAAGIYVINSIYPWGGVEVDEAVRHVEAVRNHPAILMWLVGNEWNYNSLYTGGQYDSAWTIARVQAVARAVQQADPNHPVATSYGHIPTQEVMQAIPDVDIWGVNIYSGISFGSLFDDFSVRTTKPLLVTEYGADAFNANVAAEDQGEQAHATRVLTNLIFDHASATRRDGVCIGGALYSWSDEWWKAGNPWVQDTGGEAPGGGPHPDSTFNEEFWGIVDVDRNPRLAYTALKQVYSSR